MEDTRADVSQAEEGGARPVREGSERASEPGERCAQGGGSGSLDARSRATPASDVQNGESPGRRARWAGDTGMATAEYAIATLAAAAFAGVLLVIMRRPEVKDALFGIISQALAA